MPQAEEGNNKMITLYAADCRQNNKNCVYPHRIEVTDAESLKKAVAHDYVCAEYSENRRSIDRFVQADCLAFDVDNDHSDDPNEWILPKDVADFFGGVEFWVHYSRSNQREKNGKEPRPKFHVLFSIDRCSDADCYAALKQEIFRIFPYVDGQALDAARFFFGTDEPNVEFWPGVRNLSDFLRKRVKKIDGVWVQRADSALPPASEHDSSETERNHFSRIPQGCRNTTMHRFALKSLTRYGNSERAKELFFTEAERCDPPLPVDELRATWHSAVKYYENVISVSKDYIPPDQYGRKSSVSLKPADLTDLGQAKVLVREYRDELIFTESTNFLRYDGKRWLESRQLAIGAMEEFLDFQLADAEDCIQEAIAILHSLEGIEIDLAGGPKALLKQAGKLAACGYKEKARIMEKAAAMLEEAKVYKAFVLKRRDMKYVLSALEAAKPMVLMKISDLDKNEFLLNTPDATYDLRYGLAGALAQEPKDYITQITAFNPSEKGREIWLKALDTFFCGDKDLICYVQEVIGLAAIGKVYVEQLIIAYGQGKNGKSSLFNTISRVMGTYSGQMSADTLTVGVKRNVKPELAELKGKRLIIAAELEEGTRLNTSMVKQLSSTDEIYAEKKYKDPFRFTPSHTLVLYTNHLPRVGATDEGTWRRLVVIPFLATIRPESDIKNFTEYLVTNAGEAVMAWIIEGAERVIRQNFDIRMPETVKAAVKAYRDSNNWLQNFLEECCELGPSLQEKSGMLYQEYRDTCNRNGEWARSTADFYSALETAGFERKKKKDGNYILGLKLKLNFCTLR